MVLTIIFPLLKGLMVAFCTTLLDSELRQNKDIILYALPTVLVDYLILVVSERLIHFLILSR